MASSTLPAVTAQNTKLLEEDVEAGHYDQHYLTSVDSDGNAKISKVARATQNSRGLGDMFALVDTQLEKLGRERGQQELAKSLQGRLDSLKPKAPQHQEVSASLHAARNAVSKVIQQGRLPGTPPRPSVTASRPPPPVPTEQPDVTRAASASSANSGLFIQANIFFNAIEKDIQLYTDPIDKKEERLLSEGIEGQPISHEGASISVLKFFYAHGVDAPITDTVDQVAMTGIELFEKLVGTFHRDISTIGKIPDASFQESLSGLSSQITKFARAIQPPPKRNFLSGTVLESTERRIRLLVQLLINAKELLVIQELTRNNTIDRYLSYFFGNEEVNEKISEITIDIKRAFRKIQINDYSVLVDKRTVIDLTESFEIFITEIARLSQKINELREGDLLTSIGFKHCYKEILKLQNLLVLRMKYTTYRGVNYFKKLDEKLQSTIDQIEKEVTPVIKAEKEERLRGATISKREESKTTNG